MDKRDEPTFRDLAALLRRGLVIVLAVGVGAGALAYFLSKRETPVYDATATVLASQPDSGLQSFNVNLVTGPTLDVSAYQAAATSTPVLAQALQLAGQPGSSRAAIEDFARRVSVKTAANPKSSLIYLSVASSAPKVAAAEANALANALRAWDKQRASKNLATIVDTLKAQLSSLDAQISQAQTSARVAASQLSGMRQLRAQQALQLTAAEALQTSAVGHLEVLQPAEVPIRPSAPHPLRSAALLFVLGIFVMYGLLILRDAFDTRYRSTSDISAETRVPVLAEFPHTQGGTRSLPGEAADFLRANVLIGISEESPKVLLVTSSGSGHGKTSVAMGLAESFARSDYRTLLLDADLRRPVSGKEYGLNMLEYAPLQSYLEDSQLPFEPAHVRVGDSVLDVVPSYKPASSPTVLLSHGFADVLARVRSDYDAIVVDSAPVIPVADTLAIAPQATGVVFAISLPDTDRRSSKAALDLLARIGARVLGSVATNLEKSRGRGGEYGYGTGLGPDYGPDGRRVVAHSSAQAGSRQRSDQGGRSGARTGSTLGVPITPRGSDARRTTDKSRK